LALADGIKVIMAGWDILQIFTGSQA